MDDDRLDLVFGALADRTRRGILTRPARSRRGAVRLSHLRAEPLAAATAWLGTDREYRDESFDRVDAPLTTIKNEGRPS